MACDLWHPPHPNELKCNVDVAYQSREQRWGWGAAIRNHAGSLVAYRTGWTRGQPEVREGEARGLLDALYWAVRSQLHQVVFEVDSQVVASAVNGQESNLTEFGVIIDGCRLILLANPGYEVVFVRRNRNVVAHELARRSFSLASPFEGYVPPTWLIDALALKCIDPGH
ncbi:hypothetical protein LINPERHAP1_LOCUS36775 [Linum perenne]